jgi:hypothetical protein
MLPEGWVELSDKDLDRLDAIDRMHQDRVHLRLETRIREEFRNEGALSYIVSPYDRCLILGHEWLSERLITRRCRVCNLWEAL